MNYKFKPKKFADRELDRFITAVFKNHELNPDDNYVFDISDLEFIGNQELLVLSALLELFVEARIRFRLILIKPGVATEKIPKRVQRQLIQLWDVWQIWQIAPQSQHQECFGLTQRTIDVFKMQIGYREGNSEIFTRHGVTPFVILDYINNYRENDIINVVDSIYILNSLIKEILRNDHCQHPFTSQALSAIITEELYLNFLDHSIHSSFLNLKNLAFMSISFQRMIDAQNPELDIQELAELNFRTEQLPESKSFFFDEESQTFLNFSYIQFSFVDFGLGIAATLREEFIKQQNDKFYKAHDSEIIDYAFQHHSSRHPIDDISDLERNIPRGLFDAYVIVKRYKGLMIVRSNSGRVVYDFSKGERQTTLNKDLNEAYLFPGTLITIYLPAADEQGLLQDTPIKPEIEFKKVRGDRKRHLSFMSIVEGIDQNKASKYNQLIQAIKVNIESNEPSLIFFDFEGADLEEPRLIKKALYFLLTGYDINYNNNVIILGLPNHRILKEIEEELLELNKAVKRNKVHPLPCLNYNPQTDEINLKWLGVFDEEDKAKLDTLLLDTIGLSQGDFNFPSALAGHLHAFDKNGNLITNFPERTEIIDFIIENIRESNANEVKRLIVKHRCLHYNEDKNIYLCSGNFYQKEYIELNDLVSNSIDGQIVSRMLYEALAMKAKDLSKYMFIGITATSQRILAGMEAANLISKDDYVTLDHYHQFEKNLDPDILNVNMEYILICDVVSTGYLTRRLEKKLNEYGLKLAFIGAIVDAFDPQFRDSDSFIDRNQERLISLYNYPIRKYDKKEIIQDIQSNSLDIIRVNHHTNIPITLSIQETNYYEHVIFYSEINYDRSTNEIIIQNQFLNAIQLTDLRVGYLMFNNVIHPYFFNTDTILPRLGVDFLGDVFGKINKRYLETEQIKLFYPRKSGIENFDVTVLKKVLSNDAIEVIEIERFSTKEGWRFPHSSDFLAQKIDGSVSLILDDGTCTGDSLIQMIDEIAFYDVKEIIVICFIGRIEDHKREFLSRLTSIKARNQTEVKLSIYFVAHWHIPTYHLDHNPNTNEIAWLNEIRQLPNTPRVIKRIAGSVLKAIVPKPETLFVDHQHLPLLKSEAKPLIPKKELLLIREEIGKIIGYRLYRESFEYFNYFFLKYEAKVKTKDRYKDIELLCASFVYEPYLFDSITEILPDIIQQIEDFVRVLMFSHLRIFERLTYKWDKKDIIHLFFIVFKSEKLVKELTVDNLKKLIAFTRPKESALNYVLYKLLIYFPVKIDDIDHKEYNNVFKELLYSLKEDTTVSRKELRKYYNFVSSLPSRMDFNSQLLILKDSYGRQTDPFFHDEKISFNHNVSLVITAVRKAVSDFGIIGKISSIDIKTIQKGWFEILTFVNPILIFTSSFERFIIPYPYFRLFEKVKSLRTVVGYNEELIFTLTDKFNDVEKLKQLIKNITFIQTDFEVNSDFHQLIATPYSSITAFIAELKSGLINNGFKIKTNDIHIGAEQHFKIPQHYTDKLLTRELITNILNHATPGTEIELWLKLQPNNKLGLTIKNEIAIDDFDKSNGEGIKCLGLLAEFEPFGFRYNSQTYANNFQQRLTFNLSQHGN